MRVLVVGGGAREHAIVWKLRQSANVSDIVCAPGNAGMADLATCVDVPETSIEKLADLAVVQNIDLTVASSEPAVHNGIVDYFKNRRLRIFGPDREAARLAWSPYFAKELMLKNKIPTARYAAFEREELARVYIESRKPPIVLKAAAPGGGQTVTIAETHGQARQALSALFARAGNEPARSVIVEDFLGGRELSLAIICDGSRAVSVLPAHNARRLHEDDKGPLTPGMGAYAPDETFPEELMSQVVSEVTDPLLKALSEHGTPFCGAMNINLSVDDAGRPRVLGFGSSFGHLESQVVLPLLDDDLFELFWAVTEKNLAHFHSEGLKFSPYSCLAVALVADGYPAQIKAGLTLTGLDQIDGNTVMTIEKQVVENAKPVTIRARPFVFHEASAKSGTAASDDLQSQSGRVLTVGAIAETLLDAKTAVYELVKRVDFEGKRFRRDIGYRGLG